MIHFPSSFNRLLMVLSFLMAVLGALGHNFHLLLFGFLMAVWNWWVAGEKEKIEKGNNEDEQEDE